MASLDTDKLNAKWESTLMIRVEEVLKKCKCAHNRKPKRRRTIEVINSKCEARRMRRPSINIDLCICM